MDFSHMRIYNGVTPIQYKEISAH